MSDAIQLAVLAAALIVTGLIAFLKRGPSIPRPDWPPSPTWSSRRDRMLAGATVILLVAGLAIGGLSAAAIVLAGGVKA